MIKFLVTARLPEDYPTRDLIPEHTKRGNGPGTGPPLHADTLAAFRYVNSVRDTYDLNAGGGAWYGYALREAFLAGISHARSE